MKKPGIFKRALFKVVGADKYAENRVNAAIKIVTDSFGTSLSGQNVTLDRSPARVTVSGNNALITKQSSGKSKIDPLIATFNAASLMSLNPESKGNVGDFINNMVMVGI